MDRVFFSLGLGICGRDGGSNGRLAGSHDDTTGLGVSNIFAVPDGVARRYRSFTFSAAAASSTAFDII